jgi:hypothetical protein
VAPSDPQGPRFLQTFIHYISESFHTIFSFHGPVILEKIFKDFPSIYTCKNGFPYCGPIRPPGAMIFTDLNLLYITKLPYKFQLSWPGGSSEKDFLISSPYFCNYLPFGEDLALHLNKLDSQSPKDDLY